VILRLLVLGIAGLGCAGLLSAQVEQDPQVEDTDTSPYHVALLDYKAGKFPEALDALNAGGGATPQDMKTVLLKARILTELKQYDEGEKLLRTLLAGPDVIEVQTALGDLLLRKRSFARAAKYYQAVLTAKPNDPDVTLKLIYAKIGGNDLVGAGLLASQLTPLNPKNPYDDHASYYFAQAALAQAAGKPQDALDQIQAARTNYGNTITDRYLKTYLQVFNSSDKDSSTDITPAPRVKPAAK
jgi:tetratricopeptide (TPR) repeat protein